MSTTQEQALQEQALQEQPLQEQPFLLILVSEREVAYADCCTKGNLGK